MKVAGAKMRGCMATSKIILDLCGGTGSWSKPYKDAGYDVRLVTLPDNDVREYVPPANVYGILAAPPCTEFSLAKGAAMRDFSGAMEIVQACLRIIWSCRIEGILKFWAMENPVGFMRQFLGIPHFTFEQWEFGGDRRKATDLWGYFKNPTKTHKDFPIQEYTRRNPCGSSNGRDWGKLRFPDEYADYINSLQGYAAKRAAARAITPQGFAQAFFKANR